MKKKPSRRILSLVIALCMVAALLPASALASTTVTPSPNTGNSSVDSLEVEYFSSTLYNWDESKANAATATADSTSINSGVLSAAIPGTLWTITAVDDVENGYTVSTTIDGTEYYITWTGANSADAGLTTTETTILITDTSENDSYGSGFISLAVSGGYYPYLNYYSSSKSFGGWSSGAGSDQGSQFTLYASDDTDTALTTSSITSGSQYYIYNTRAAAYLTDYNTSGSYEGKGFYFTNASNKGSNVSAFSSWSGSSQNYSVYTGLAASNLKETDNAPFNTDVVNAANLFATDGTNTSYTSVYTDVQVPFVYDSETGYYTMDSDTYGVYFANGTASSGATMSIADLPSQYASNSDSALGDIVGFAPFNYLTDTTATGKNSSNTSVTGYAINGTMTYGFGMVTSVNFQMTDNGKIDGEDIIFEFSGDDDVWVYIDNVLVLDIGGTHDAIDGTINFSTGDVTLTTEYTINNVKQSVNDNGGNYTSNSDGSLSEKDLYTALNTTLTAFAAEGEHTMTIYYMDRGRGKTNCMMRFNLPQEDSLSVTKNIASTYTDNGDGSTGDTIDDDTMANLSNIDFSFTLYDGENSFVANASYSLYDADGNFVQTGSTDLSGTFTLKNGYTAVFNNVDLDKEGSWYVVENLSSSRWVTTSTYEATINSSTTTGSGDATSGTVTLTDGQEDGEDKYIGSDLSSDSIAYVFTNQYVKGADPDVDVYDETIVLDYGLPVEVDVTANDITTLYGKSISEGYNPVYDLKLVSSTTTTTDDEGNETITATTTDKLEGTYGYATINDDGNIVYTLTEDFCGIETVQYRYSVTVTVEDDDGNEVEKTGSAIGTLTIIPATSVYYEEDFSYTGESTSFTKGNVSDWNNNSNFISIATNKATFSVENDGKTTYGTYQETGFVGTTDDSTYGTDEVYLDNLKDSYGTSLKVDTSDGAAQYTYTFTGTGTTIYGRVSADTGYIKVTIYPLDEKGNRITKEETSYEGSEDTYTTYETADEEVIDTANLVSIILDEELYNIPVYQYTALDYGTYEVRVYVYPEGTTTSTSNKNGGGAGKEFYLDGVRVFNPMGTASDYAENPYNEEENLDEYEAFEAAASDYATAASAYATDGEANMVVVNIHDKLTGDDDYGIFTLTDIDGGIATVGSISDDSTDEDGNTYVAVGPNQEFYLKGEGYTMTFALVNWSSTSYKIYLGMKAPAEEASTVTFSTYTLDDETDPSTLGTLSINNSSDCYYDISSYVDVHTITITDEDSGDEEDITVGFVTVTSSSENLLALTNIKVTGVDEFDLNYASNELVDNEEGNEEEGNGSGLADESTANTIYLTSTAYAASLFADEEEEEVQVFEPSSINVSTSYAKLTKKATVTVSTSSDVAYVTIDGTKVTGTSIAGGKLKFSKSFTKVASGTSYEVIAYDADGVASVTYTTTAK